MMQTLPIDRKNYNVLHDYIIQISGITKTDLKVDDYIRCEATHIYMIRKNSKTDLICQLKCPGYQHIY